jgi:N-acetylneuraminate synthase
MPAMPAMPAIPRRDRDLFEILFVLELANNHWGRVERGLKIIRDHATIVRYNVTRPWPRDAKPL